jgi:pteridine reductase
MNGKVILVTGGAKRVGAAIVRMMHGEGANVMIHYRASAADAKALKDSLNLARAGSVATVQADLLETETLPTLILQTLDTFGRLDALVNCASTFYPTTLAEASETSWIELIGSNLKAPLFLSQAAAPHLRATRGAIINITDIHAERPLKGYLVYNVAKAGLRGLTHTLARELAPEVRVNAVAPGAIMWPDDGQFNDVEREAIINHAPLKREGSPDDIARAVKYLLMDAPYVTGQTINVDGGRHISI